MARPQRMTLFTGATGLIGRFLLRDVVLAGENLCLLVRDSKKQSAAARVDDILGAWELQLGRSLPHPKVVVGEVTESGFGMSSDDRQWVASNCNAVLHNAAILEFHGPDRTGEPWRTNLTGTENLLEVCRDLKLREMHYVSTAYVCGDRAGTIGEDEFDCKQGFRNDYEESKFLAERAVRDFGAFDALTVYRPAVVAGDAQTGYTSTYHGLYLYLKLIAAVLRNVEPDADGVRRFRARWNCTGNEIRNIVPVDWVSEAMARLFRDPAAVGKTFHLSPRNPIVLRDLVHYIGTYFNSEGVEFCGTEGLNTDDLTPIEKEGYASIAIYQPYLTTDPRFDTANLDRHLPDLPCPDLSETMIHRFIRYGEEDRWGKRRGPTRIPRVDDVSIGGVEQPHSK